MNLRIDIRGVAVRVDDADLTLRQVRALLMDVFTIVMHLPDENEDEPDKPETDRAPIGFSALMERGADVDLSPYYDDEE